TLSGTGADGQGALAVLGVGGASLTGTVTLAGATTIRTDSPADFLGAVGGSGALTKTGASFLQLRTANPSFTGAVTVSQGVLEVFDAQGLGSAAAGTTVQAGATLEGAFGGTSSEPLTLNGNGATANAAFDQPVGALLAANSLTFSGPVTLASNAAVA